MAKRSFSPEVLTKLREMPVTEALDLVGLAWKRDQDFKPVKDLLTVRLHVPVGGQIIEFLVTGTRFFDAGASTGGGGAIDLIMHIFRLDFVSAVNRLLSAQMGRG